ncbi:MAG: bioF [Chlamydiales bacterium]|jgi:8-amino-7-oxononanoate synthase|nr:bioF [Chlamydiales bacterium]
MTGDFGKRLVQRESVGNLRKLQLPLQSIDFASNDYLGLTHSQGFNDLIKWEQAKVQKIRYGYGSTGSRLLTGNTQYAQDLEDTIAKFHGYEAGALFNCGYMANLGLLTAVATKNDTILFDLHIHASIHDGIRLSQAQAYPFRHNDCQHLERRLQSHLNKGNCFICIESIYSTDGSIAPLQEICHIACKYGAYLIVDEAHATGIWGPQGKGYIAEYDLMKYVFAQTITFGKALGVHGAIVLGSSTLKQLIINYARSFIYTTALPLDSLVAIACSYQWFPNLHAERLHLKTLIQNIQKLHSQASITQIQSMSVKGNHQVKQIGTRLQMLGFDVRPLTSPTVPKGHECLRICLHAFNTEDEVEDLFKFFQKMRGSESE